MWNFQGTWFLALEFSSDLTRFCRMSMGGALFYLDFPGVKKWNIPHGVFKKVCPQPPSFFFSEIAQHIPCLIEETESHFQWRLILLLTFYLYKTTSYFKTTLREIKVENIKSLWLCCHNKSNLTTVRDPCKMRLWLNY